MRHEVPLVLRSTTSSKLLPAAPPPAAGLTDTLSSPVAHVGQSCSGVAGVAGLVPDVADPDAGGLVVGGLVGVVLPAAAWWADEGSEGRVDASWEAQPAVSTRAATATRRRVLATSRR
jgi:hypothetical protein